MDFDITSGVSVTYVEPECSPNAPNLPKDFSCSNLVCPAGYRLEGTMCLNEVQEQSTANEIEQNGTKSNLSEVQEQNTMNKIEQNGTKSNKMEFEVLLLCISALLFVKLI